MITPRAIRLLAIVLALAVATASAIAALKEPVPMVREYRASADRAWLALQSPPEGWTRLATDSLVRFVTLATALDPKNPSTAKAVDGTEHKAPSSGTVAASLWVQALGDTASRVHIRVRIYGPRGNEQSQPTQGVAERALFGIIEARLGMGPAQ